MAPCTTPSTGSLRMESCRDWIREKSNRALEWLRTITRRRTRRILRSGNRRKPKMRRRKLHGIRRGVGDARDGISSARRWRCATSAKRWTFIAAESISFSRTTRMKSRNQRAQPARLSRASGATANFFSRMAARWQSASGMSQLSQTCATRVCPRQRFARSCFRLITESS